MGKKKQTKKEEEVKQEVEIIEEVETPKDPKQVIMEDFISFYNENVKGHSVVSAAIGKQIVNYFNAYSDSRVIYTGCGSCVATKITYMRRQAKEKYNLVF